MSSEELQPCIGLFATCLLNVFRPEAGFSAVELLERSGCTVEVPPNQTCCGQPGYNNGDFDAARVLAKQLIRQFEKYDFVVAPSGSCAAMIRKEYPGLFQAEDPWRKRAEALSAKTWELMAFLVDVRGMRDVAARFDGVVTYHDSCSGLRELGVKAQPRALLGSVAGLELREMRETESCCGFGGTFCVKYPEISTRMVDDKLASIAATQADTVLGGDLGCLMNIAGRAAREGTPLRVFHVAEVLAGHASGEGIAGRKDSEKDSDAL